MTLAPYLAFGRIAFLQILAYRLRYFTGIVTYLVNVSVYYFIWKALYHERELIQGFSFQQMITYVTVGWIIRSFYFNNVDRDMANDVQQGHIAAKLSRPVNYQAMQFSQAAGEAIFRLLLFTLPTSLVILTVYRVQYPASPLYGVLFVASLAFSFVIFSALNFIVGTCAIYFHSILSLIRAKYFLIEILSGLIIPLSFFPAPLSLASSILPFQHISYTPLMIYMGKIRLEELTVTLLQEVAWCGGLVLLGHWLWSRAMRHLVIQGG